MNNEALEALARDIAVTMVDGIRGHTVEFSASPEMHASDYDFWQEHITEKIRAALSPQREGLGSSQEFPTVGSGLPQDDDISVEELVKFLRSDDDPKRPNIGEPGFQWAVGMVCQVRGGWLATVKELDPEDNEMVARAFHERLPTWTYHQWVDQQGNGTLDKEDDLIRVIRWPDGYEETAPKGGE